MADNELTDSFAIDDVMQALVDHYEQVLNVLSIEGNEDEEELPTSLRPKDVSDLSGPKGPFDVQAFSPDSENNDEKVVVGQDSVTVDVDEEDNKITVPRSRGRSEYSPGFIVAAVGYLTLTSQDKVDLWDQAKGTDSPPGYQTALLYMDFTSWDGTDVTDTSQFCKWITLPFDTSNKDFLYKNSGSILPLAFVTAKNSEGTEGNDDYVPREVVSVFGLTSSSVIYLSGGSSGSNMLAKITGAPSNGEYPVDFYGNGKNEDPTGSGTIEVLNLCLSETLPVDTWVVANKVNSIRTGGDTSVSSGDSSSSS